MSNGMILTNEGRNLLAKALTGKTLKFTRAFVGTADLGNYNPASLTNLIAPRLELPIRAMRTSQTGVAEVTVEITNEKITQGFFMKEYGLFAQDPDTLREILYSYCNKGSESGFLEGYDGSNLIHFSLSLITVISQAQNITATLSNSYSYVTQTNLDVRLADLFAASDTPAGFFTYKNGDPKRLRPLTLEQTRQSLMGLTDIASLISRVERAEDAINQITLALNVQEIYPGVSHYMAEDFLNPDTIDLYSAQITSIVAGDDSIDCTPIDGLLPGGTYTITDGSQSEDVQVESVSLENGVMRVILYDDVKNSYSLTNCRLLRTTSDIQGGIAYGTPHLRSIAWLPGYTWKGLASSSSFAVNLDSSISAMNNYSFYGQAVINSDGAFTLGG